MARNPLLRALGIKSGVRTCERCRWFSWGLKVCGLHDVRVGPASKACADAESEYEYEQGRLWVE
jgi:hypothetical protein